MNTKFILFLSTTLTAFVVATLYGVVTTMNAEPTPVMAAAEVPTEAQVVEEVIPEITLPVATEPVPLTPDRAAIIAADAIGKQDVYSVEYKTNESGVEGFEVVFSSNDIVFISMNSMVYSISALPTEVVYTYAEPTDPPVKVKDNSNNKSNKNKDKDDDEHEDEHDDD